MIKQFNALKISHKLLLSILAFSLPILLLLYFTVSGINYDIHFAQQELLGNRILQPLTELNMLIHQHQHQKALEFIAQERSTAVSSIENQIDEAFTTLINETAEVGTALKIDATGLQAIDLEEIQPSQLSQVWQRLKAQSIPPTETAPQYEELLSQVQTLISQVGDTSNLILDPDLDSYYLMDIVLLALPDSQKQLGSIFYFDYLLSAPAKNQTRQAEYRTQAAIQTAFLQANLDRIQKDVATSLQDDHLFYGVSASLQQKLPPALDRYKTDTEAFIQQLNQRYISEQTSSSRTPATALEEQSDQVWHAGLDLWKITRQELDQLLNLRIQFYQHQRSIYLLLSLGALAFSSFCVITIAKQITTRLAKVVSITEEVAQGNLLPQVRVDAPDEIGRLLMAIRTMIHNLNTLISETQGIGIQLASSATELMVTTKQQSATVEQQTASTASVLHSVQEISCLTKQLTQSMAEVTSFSDATAQLADRGFSDLTHLGQEMQDMQTAADTISQKLQQISQKTERITMVITTITKVADQTNLLSLNAAIEAEKAGKYGQGFAVVAREIRRLADQTAVATLDIEKMVQEMQASVAEGVADMRQFVRGVANRVGTTSEISDHLVKIMQQVQMLSPKVEDINEVMRHQAENTQTINQAMTHLSEGMQETRSSLKETFTAIAQLNDAAHELRSQISQFQVNTADRSFNL